MWGRSDLVVFALVVKIGGEAFPNILCAPAATRFLVQPLYLDK